jgi:methylmalonyl-CoA mutase cobalamin-binding domain/chain
MGDFTNLTQAILEGQYAAAEDEAGRLLTSGDPPDEVIRSITATLNEVGQRFSSGEVFIPEMLVSAKAAQRAIDALAPALAGTERKTLGRIVMGSVKGDLHDLGKNVLALMLRGAGFEVLDLGINVSEGSFVCAIQEFKPQIVALSCLITTTMQSIPLTISAIEKAGLRSTIKVMIGGPPTSDVYAQKSGADFYGKDAQVGVEFARRVVGE